MSTSSIKRLPKSTVEMTIIIPWKEIKENYDKVFKIVAKDVEIKGFRKGKAPRELVKNRLDSNKLYEQVIKELVPKVYQEEIKKHQLQPITLPDINLKEAKEENDWKLIITIAEKPEVDLGNYRTAVSKARKSKEKIWLPGQKEDQNDEKKKTEQISEILKAILKEAKIELSDLLIQREVNRNLSTLLDEIKKLGLTLEQYLKSLGKTADQLRKEHAKQAEETLKLEFILEAIAEKENITVTDKDIEGAIAKVQDEDEKKRLRQQSYYLATVIRRQKTLDSLLKPIV